MGTPGPASTSGQGPWSRDPSPDPMDDVVTHGVKRGLDDGGMPPPSSKSSKTPDSRGHPSKPQEQFSPLDGEVQDAPVVVVAQALCKKAVFADPTKVLDAFNQSVFGKIIVEGTLKVLGTGSAIRFEIISLARLGVSLESVSKLGPWDVRCWQPPSSLPASTAFTYGKIGPIAVDITEGSIADGLRLFDQISSRVVEVHRLRYRLPSSSEPAGDAGAFSPSLTVRVKFSGPLPSRVGIGHTVYAVSPFHFPVLRCFTCLRFGHGSISCRSKLRCVKCSGFHSATDCTNTPACFFCRGAHRATHKFCPVVQSAREFSRNLEGDALREKLRSLNPGGSLNLASRPRSPPAPTPATGAPPPPSSVPPASSAFRPSPGIFNAWVAGPPSFSPRGASHNPTATTGVPPSSTPSSSPFPSSPPTAAPPHAADAPPVGLGSVPHNFPFDWSFLGSVFALLRRGFGLFQAGYSWSSLLSALLPEFFSLFSASP